MRLISLSSSSDNLQSETIDENTSNSQTDVDCLPKTESTMFIVTSPSITSELSAEQNDSIDPSNASSLLFLQTRQQRQTNHRRIKSEPVKSASTEDLPSIINNHNSIIEPRRKSSIKIPSNNNSPSTIIKQISQDKSSSSTTSTRKKKPWYNVSVFYY